MIRRLFQIGLLLLLHTSIAQHRREVSLNEGWRFRKENAAEWQKLAVPHTWNADDPFDDEPSYYRGSAVYIRELILNEKDLDQRLYLKFEAVNQTANVFVNDQLAGSHRGGYTAFFVPISTFTKAGINTLRVEVTNAHDSTVIPLKGDFNFYGGIYRDVWLEVEEPVHFYKTPYGNDAVYLSAEVTDEHAVLELKGAISKGKKKQPVQLLTKVFDQEGNQIAVANEKLVLKEAETDFDQQINLVRPHLWSPDSPYLYVVQVEIKDPKSGALLDQYQTTYGFRYFRFDANEGFFINGKHLKLIGANRHQDYPGLGNALTDDRHRADVWLLKQMGANFFRTAHYPQDQSVLEASDQSGLLVSMEIPLDHELTDIDEFYNNTRQMMREMIHQYYNHPSIIIWAYMNEMFLGRNAERDQEDIQTIVSFAEKMEAFTRAEDPTRYTMIPNHGDFDLYHNAGLTRIPMLVGWNLYFGWYGEGFDNFSKFLQRFHKELPDKPVIITEFGAGSDPRIRSLKPKRFDFSVDWQLAYHQSYLQQINDLDFLAGAAVWNLFDFGSEGRQDAVPYINSKGLMSHDRQPKDSYRMYQANCSDDPFVEILPTNFPVLPATLDDMIFWPISVVTNLDRAELSINGKALETKSVKNGIATWKVALQGTQLRVQARAFDLGNELRTTRNFELSSGLNINLGAPFYFYDPAANMLWIPDQEWKKSKVYGHISGRPYEPRSVGVGSDRAIQLTFLDPLYQSQLQDVKGFQFNVKPGLYQLELKLAMLLKDLNGRFQVWVNDTYMDTIDSQSLMAFTATDRVYQLYTSGAIKIEFKSERGTTFLNAIKLIKIN